VLLEDRKPPSDASHAGAPLPADRRIRPGTRALRATSPLRSRLVVNLVTAVVTVVFSYVALSGLDLKVAWHALLNCDYWWLLPALLAFGLGNVARALRWRSLFAHGRRPPFSTVMNAMMIGYFYNNILPARAGEAARVVVLTGRSEAPPVEIVGTVVLERLYDVVSILVIFFVAQPWLPAVSWFHAAAVAAIVLAVFIGMVAAVLAIYGDRPLRLLLRPFRRFSLLSGDRLDRTVSELAYGLSGLRNKGVALEAFMWTIAAWLLSALCAYLVSLAFHLGVPFVCGVLVVVAVGIGMILPSPPAAVGVFEGAALIALKAYGVPHSEALPYALVLHLVNFVPFVVVGFLLLQYNARHPGRLLAARAPAEAPATVPS
jgi:glycosyltransferase 2 family protein